MPWYFSPFPAEPQSLESESDTLVTTPDTTQSGQEEVDASSSPDESPGNANGFVEKLVNVNDVFFSILSLCGAATLHRLSRTCSSAHSGVQSYMSHAFNVNPLLLRFFPDALAFRSLQARTGTLISGSAALQFFDRAHYPEADLDLYVYMHARLEVGTFLLEAGYRFVPNSKQHPDFHTAILDPRVLMRSGGYSMPGVAGVFTFMKPSPVPGQDDVKVQIILASNAPMQVVFGFHSTCVMNVVAYDKAYALYPQATFEERISLVCKREAERQDDALTKYEERGWSMLRVLPNSADDCDDSGFQLGPRFLGDGHSWVIPLDLAGVDRPPRASPLSAPLSQDPVAATSWRVGRHLATGMAVIEFDTIQSEVLRYSYVIRDDEIERIVMDMLLARCAMDEDDEDDEVLKRL
ncbi:hypothetical protein CERSUDRAFT_44125 [Gelatoporia subvermispora B]|uniref:Uncharacterized protein n=1 Tax=Ceriporiopsis subvermispora (strain B) TaxID=914234 RepID=M2RP91_CERS8|nr:hypothetical protein CERSUDRAFT_44125 [Gelatoporia subvermispora B]